MTSATLDYFRVIVIADDQPIEVLETYLDRGIILNFVPNRLQQKVIEEFIMDNKVKTLFSTREESEGTLYDKIIKQLHHYAATYRFDQPEAVMNIEGHGPVPLIAIRGVTRATLQGMVDTILYANRPAKDTEVLVKVMAEHGLTYRLNEIRNNELRVQLFDEASGDTFEDGDDAVRWIVYKSTGQSLLIKSREVVSKVEENARRGAAEGIFGGAVTAAFLERHQVQLARCFNRHKRILVALKVGSERTAVKYAINHIARMSKRFHQPIALPKSKTFINDALRGFGVYDPAELDRFRTHDLFRFLNLIAFKELRLPEDVFIIRNGKTWARADRPVHDATLLRMVEDLVLGALHARIAPHLKGKTIVLPASIDYGLPITRKQCVGQLPFGTRVTVPGAISSGIYWRDEWGATDLDLSAVDDDGDRVGWGRRSGYESNGISFSGDIVGAPDGAMEFLTSSTRDYGLFVNIFAGAPGCGCELVVGQRSTTRWMENPQVREKFKLDSRQNIVGFVDGRTFTVFLGRVGRRRASFDTDAVVLKKGQSYVWTVKLLLEHCGSTWVETAKEADHDLSYATFTFDKLEALFGAKAVP